MNTEEKLAGYASTMDFVNELKKYIKITRVCDNSEITKCFNKEIIWNADEDPVDMSTIKNAESFGLDWESDTVAVQFANGVNAVIAYNPNTTQDPYNNQFSATSNSMAILYDVSGNKNPNTNNKDISHNANVKQLAGVTGCLLPEEDLGFCITQVIPADGGYTPLTREQCEELSDLGYGNKKEECGESDNDYWAGAVKACGGTQNMPTQTQLEQLAAYIYPDADAIKGDWGVSTDANWDADRASLFTAQSPFSYFLIFTDREDGKYGAFSRSFYPTETTWTNYSRTASNAFLAVCLDQ